MSLEVKKAVLLEEVERWKRGLYLLQVRARVQKSIGNEVALQALEKELEHQEQGLDALREEWKALEDSPVEDE